MARNQHPGPCYLCGRIVAEGTGHFERYKAGWRVKHANHPGHGRVTCEMVKRATETRAPKNRLTLFHGF